MAVPLAPVLVALVVLTVLTHLPFVLLLVVLFFGFGRAGGTYAGGPVAAGHRLHRRLAALPGEQRSPDTSC